jgi:hypothetical protein
MPRTERWSRSSRASAYASTAARRCSSHRATAARANSSSAKSARAGPRHRPSTSPRSAARVRGSPAARACPTRVANRTASTAPGPARSAYPGAWDTTSSRPSGSAPASARRSCETRTCSAAVGSAGAASPHRSSTSRSTDTGRPSWTSRSASKARTLRPGIVTGSSWSVHTASGPSTPNRITPGYGRRMKVFNTVGPCLADRHDMVRRHRVCRKLIDGGWSSASTPDGMQRLLATADWDPDWSGRGRCGPAPPSWPAAVPAERWVACSPGHGAKGRPLYDRTGSSWPRPPQRRGRLGPLRGPPLAVLVPAHHPRAGGARLLGRHPREQQLRLAS